MVASTEVAARNQDPASIEPTYINGILIANKTYPLPSWWGDGLTGETVAAFDAMQAEAAGQGHSLYISSGFRSYASQASIYNSLVAQVGVAGADRDTARPGHSEHQTGLTVDLNCICEGFGYQADGQWVAANAHRFGFIVRYPQGKEPVTGYIWEPWHLRYLGVENATAVYNSGLSLEEYLGITSSYN
jgi:LAS superfamily LD-carboxypeptidase LdcB